MLAFVRKVTGMVHQRWVLTLKLRPLAFLCLFSCLLGGAALALAGAPDKPIQFSLPAGDLADALDKLGDQSGVQIMYEPALAKGIKVAAVNGTLTVGDALKQLLAPNGLRADPVNDKTVVIKRAEAKKGSSKQDVSSTLNRDPQESTAALEEIVVTAQKRSESLSKTPLAISAVSQEQLSAAGVLNLQDLSTQVPNLEIGNDSFLGNAVVLTIRGITSNYFDYAGDPAVATYLDGVYIPRTQGLNTGFFDLERVEVLRGPQGTLYGRNTLGGNVNIITAEPKNQFEASAELSYGNYNDVQTQATVNLPLTDTLSVRAAFMTHRNDGYYDTHGTTARNYGVSDDFGGRLSALWRPSENFKWRLTVEDFANKGTFGMFIQLGPNGKPADGLSPFNQPINPYPEPSMDLETFSIRSRMDWEIGSGFSVAYVAGYQHLKNDYVGGSANSPETAGVLALGNAFFGNNRNENYMHEVDLNYDSAQFKNILGGAYFHEASVDQPIYYLFTIPLAFRSFVPDYGQQAWGIFDQATYSVTDALRLTGGLRYSHDEKHNLNDTAETCGANSAAALLATYPLVTLRAASEFGALPGCALTNLSGQGTWSGTNWKAGVDYDLNANTLGYVSVTTGYQEGGINESAGGPTYGPEKAISYEAGVKTRLMDGRLSVNADIFLENVTDLQVVQHELYGQVTTNAAAARVYGIENENHWLVTDRDRLDISLNYLSAKFTNYTNAIDALTGAVFPSLDGNYLPKAPGFSGRVRYGHDFDMAGAGTLTPSAEVYYQTVTYLTEFNQLTDRVPAYSRTGLALTYKDTTGRWLVEAFVHNLENDYIRNVAYALAGVNYGIYDAPRTFGVRATFKY